MTVNLSHSCREQHSVLTVLLHSHILNLSVSEIKPHVPPPLPPPQYADMSEYPKSITFLSKLSVHSQNWSSSRISLNVN